jgi:serine/threonine protein kinase
LIAGKYRLESLLGEGGMGAVFRARHQVMDKPVAVKWLKPTCGDEVAARHRFMQEARAAARIRHPNVVDVYDVGEQDGCLFMVMELLEGETFADFLERSGVPVAEALRHLLAAMRGVAAAHAAGITHRDIKPENVFIAVDPLHIEGVAKILDFGISKLHDEPQSHLTLAGTTMGTPHYMSYEQIRCMTDVDHRTDVYAFGVLLYQALTGALPYDADTLQGIVMQAASGRAVRPIERRPDLPPELDELVMKAIALRPDDRFQSMDAMINALTRIQLARYAWSASTERASWTPPSSAATVLLLSTPRHPDSGPASSNRSAAPRPPRAARSAPLPLNPWLGLVGVALGLLSGGTLYTRIMTPTSPASAKASESAPVPSSVMRERRALELAPEAATARFPGSPVAAAGPDTPKTAPALPAPPDAPAPRDALASTSMALSPSAALPVATQAPLAQGLRSQGTTDLRSRAEEPRASTVAPSRATKPPSVAKLSQGPSAALPSRAEEASAAQQPAAEPAPAPAAAAHRSGPLRLEDL